MVDQKVLKAVFGSLHSIADLLACPHENVDTDDSVENSDCASGHEQQDDLELFQRSEVSITSIGTVNMHFVSSYFRVDLHVLVLLTFEAATDQSYSHLTGPKMQVYCDKLPIQRFKMSVSPGIT